MNKFLIVLFISLLSVILVVGVWAVYKNFSFKELSEGLKENLPSNSSSSLVTLEKTITPVPDEIYSFGAFCRVNYLPNTDEFFITFGGANPTLQNKNPDPQARAGGAEGGNGYSYKVYSKDFEYTGKNGIIHQGGGDAASVVADDYYYFLTGGREGWVLKKIEPTTWQTVKSVDISLDQDHEISSDQMLAWSNGKLFASSQYDSSEPIGRKVDPFVGAASHVRVFDTELNQLDYFVLDDELHSNGSYLVYANEVYNYITSSAYFGDLIVMQYDKDWNYLGQKKLDEWALWSQGALYDAASQRFFVAYLDMDLNEMKKRVSNINVALGVFDKDWNLLEKVMVTDFTNEKNAGRPWVILQEGKLYVSYDIATEGQFDWQCETKIYSLN